MQWCVLHSALELGRVQGLVWLQIPPGLPDSGTLADAPQVTQCPESVPVLCCLCSGLKEQDHIRKLILGTQGVTASPYMPLGPWISLGTKPFVQGLLGSAIHGYTPIFISSYSELRSKCVPTEPTKLIFSAPACLAFFLSSLLPYTSYF